MGYPNGSQKQLLFKAGICLMAFIKFLFNDRYMFDIPPPPIVREDAPPPPPLPPLPTTQQLLTLQLYRQGHTYQHPKQEFRIYKRGVGNDTTDQAGRVSVPHISSSHKVDTAKNNEHGLDDNRVWQSKRNVSTTGTVNPRVRIPWVEIEPTDTIYDDHPSKLRTVPIVIESHKLIFFPIPKVGCSVWKMLFRRMMGYAVWKTKDLHDPARNGLRYLSHYNISRATQLMNDPTWTRAIFVRDPKERLLSAYLNKVFYLNGTHIKEESCCKMAADKDTCWEQFKPFARFVHLAQQCEDSHWQPQSQRLEPKYLSLLNFVGHLDTVSSDAEQLLKRIGAWETYGQSGWGANGSDPIFSSQGETIHTTSKNASESHNRLAQYYTQEIELEVERWYADDYRITQFGLPRKRILYHQ